MVDKKLAGCFTEINAAKRLIDVPVETSDPSRICTDHEYYLTSVLATWTVELSAPSASLLTLPSLKVQLIF